MASEDERGPSRLLIKLNEAMAARKFYEAHQLMRTINFRYTSSKKLQELELLLVRTAMVLLEANQYESGSDVAIMLSKLFIDNSIPVNLERITQSIRLVKLMQASPERQNFIANIVEWGGSDDLGIFHEVVAGIYLNENSYPEGWKHLVRMSNGKQMARFALDVMKSSGLHKEEYDLTLSLLVLTLLVAKRTSLAEEVNKELHRLCGSDITDTPLCFAVQFLVEAVKLDDVHIYKTIKQVYWPSFNRESNICRLVDAMGKAVFKIPDQSSGSRNGFMSNLLHAFIQPETSPNRARSGRSATTEQLALD